MSLKHRKLFSWFCCVFAVIFLSIGFVLLRAYNESDPFYPGYGVETTTIPDGTDRKSVV